MTTLETLSKISPQSALEILKNGNKRFVKNSKSEKNLVEQVSKTSNGQYPFAVVLGCIDSRVPPELIFDLGIGDIFSIRIAGNIVNEDILGSMEFACNVIGSKHILVLGHTSCGAVEGAKNDVQLGNLTELVAKIKPAVDHFNMIATKDDQNAVDEIAEINVNMTIEEIKKRSPILKDMLNKGEIGISGGIYDVSTGEVKFFN